MITLKNVNKYFFRHKKNEIHVINDTSLELGDTGLVALLGPSGSGKTTLLNTIGGLDKINSGEIYIDGVKMPRTGSYRKDKMRVLNIGYIFQDYNLLDHLSVYENVALSLKMIGIKNKTEIKERVDYILELVGMYRYRNKPAGNLSGGQRQRVGIARALVKNPEVIIADEPTGNLDSKNTIEIMNIIKTISQEKLVILVTHEKELAHFYASRIVNIVDGKIESDILNEHENELDYKIDNKIYLRDFKNIDNIKENSNEITLYTEREENLHLDIVVKNGNIYIQSRNGEKIEVVDQDSGIEFVDDNYKKIKKDDFVEKEYDLEKLSYPTEKQHYSSIYNVISMFKSGFRKVRNYTLIKKILLFGFFFSAMFIIYALSNIFGVTTIKDEKFLTAHRDYIIIQNKNNSLKEFLKIENMKNVDYVIPGDSQVMIVLSNPKIWQLNDFTKNINGSLAGVNLVKKEDIIFGHLPENEDEIILDKRVIDATKQQDSTIEWLDLHSYEDYVGLIAKIDNLEFKIVGISDTSDPCIYFSKEKFIDVIAIMGRYNYSYDQIAAGNAFSISKYEIYKDKITLKEGVLPNEDYEVIVNIDNKDYMPLGKTIDYKIGNENLKVVGYYYSDEIDDYIVNSNTLKYSTILNNSNMLLIAKDKEAMIADLQAEGYAPIDNYTVLKEKYIKGVRDSIIESLILAGVLLAISFIEIFLMIRASFLSRIKEVGIYRAIGVKKTDIYKMFLGEVIIITTLAGLPGAILMGAIMKEVTSISYFNNSYVMDARVMILGIFLIYSLNMIVGLLPVRSTIKKTPAEILSRNDVD